MLDILLTVFLLALIALAVLAGLWLMRGHLGEGSPIAALFGQKPPPRLGVIEHASVDGRRRLVLIRRDGVEHLIMTGGPVDVVIETGIGDERNEPVRDRAVPPGTTRDADDGGTEPTTATFARPARVFGRPARGKQEIAE